MRGVRHRNAFGPRGARFLRFAGTVVALAITSPSCEPSGSPRPELVPVPSTPPTLHVDLGTGIAEFVELAEGEPVELVYGPQGGFHVWTAIRVHDDAIPEVQVNLTARLENGAPAGPPSSALTALSPSADGARSAAGLRNLIASAESVRGKRFILRVEVIARDERHGSAEKVVTAIVK